MSERRGRGKAGKLVDELLATRPLTPEELAKQGNPEVRLRGDAPSITVDEATSARDVTVWVRGAGFVALRESETSEITAIAIPLTRYLDLVGSQLEHDPSTETEGRSGSIVPTATALAVAYVERVNLADTEGSPSGH